MNRQSTARKTHHRPGAEFLLFLIVSVVGVYSLGQGLTGLFEASQGINLLWLVVTGVAMMILFAQMGRVQDNWPHRKDEAQHTAKVVATEPPVHAEER